MVQDILPKSASSTVAAPQIVVYGELGPMPAQATITTNPKAIATESLPPPSTLTISRVCRGLTCQVPSPRKSQVVHVRFRTTQIPKKDPLPRHGNFSDGSEEQVLRNRDEEVVLKRKMLDYIPLGGSLGLEASMHLWKRHGERVRRRGLQYNTIFEGRWKS
jgi:hypothetical protein